MRATRANAGVYNDRGDCEAEGITVVLMHPGAVLTERQEHLSDFPGMIETTDSVRQMIETIDGLTLEDTGRFIHYDGTTAPW